MAGLLFVLLVADGVGRAGDAVADAGAGAGLPASPEKFDLAVLLTQIAFPYLLCMWLVALLSGVLNSMRRFTAAAAAPILLNVVLIAALGAGDAARAAATHAEGRRACWPGASPLPGSLQLLLLLDRGAARRHAPGAAAGPR